MTAASGGFRVVLDPLLPAEPSPGEVGRRIVRHGMADILRWLGEEPGPAPDDLTHVVLAGDTMFVSTEAWDRLVETMAAVKNAGSPARWS